MHNGKIRLFHFNYVKLSNIHAARYKSQSRCAWDKTVIQLSEQYSDPLHTGRTEDQISVVGEIFRTRPSRPLCPPSPLHNGYQVSFLGVKRPRRGTDHPPPTIPEVKQRVKLQAYL
jgi:hypothetical protein